MTATPPSTAFVVLDLGFGDSGKGLVTDYLTRASCARTVVRFNGGAQAGHNVVAPDGRHHTFSQLGAGTFAGDVVTFLSRFVVVHPTAMCVEAATLAAKGVPDALERVWVDEDALVTTPFHQALNRLRELARGASPHGTCGVGFGETVRDGRVAGREALRVRDLSTHPILRRRLAEALERALAEAAVLVEPGRRTPRAEAELCMLSRSVADAWADRARAWAARARIVASEALSDLGRRGPVVFEGAQGVLLDERAGFLPHCTFSACTPDNALALARAHLPEHAVTRLGVLRTYMTRHGAGPLPTEDPSRVPASPEPHNGAEGWQGPFRVGWPDFVLWRHAVRACGGLDALAVTHVDALARAATWRSCDRYASAPDPLTPAALARARPLYRDHPPDDFLSLAAEELDLPVALVSTGPRASDVRRRVAP